MQVLAARWGQQGGQAELVKKGPGLMGRPRPLQERSRHGEALGQHIPKGYIYFSMAFAFGVEMLNLRLRAKSKPVELHQPYR